MEHLVPDFFTTVLILGSMLVLVGGAIGYRLVSKKGQSMENGVFNDRLGLLQDENKELKKYLKSTKGAVGQLKKGLTIDEGESLDEDNFDGVIKGLIGKYQHMCPPQFRFLLNDPTIVSFLLEEAKKHPEQTKEVLKHFISKNGDVGKESSSEESQQHQLEELTAEGA